MANQIYDEGRTSADAYNQRAPQQSGKEGVVR